MATKLEKPLRREIAIEGKSFIVTLSPEGLRIAGKGRRKGLEISWSDLVSGEAALAVALRASIDPKLNLQPAKSKAGATRARRRKLRAG